MNPEDEPQGRLCSHGIRYPHECRECEQEPSEEEIKAFMRSEGLAE